MATTLAELRKDLPIYEGVSDAGMFEDLHKTYFPTIDKIELAKKLSYDIPLKTDNTGDFLKGIGEGALRVPSMVTGLADIPAGIGGYDRPADRLTDEIGQATGFTPKKWADETQYSEAATVASKNVDSVWEDPNSTGLDVAKTIVQNPRAITRPLLSSIVPMVAGGLAGRGAAALGVDEMVALAGSEGAVSAGTLMDSIDKNADPVDSAIAATTGGAFTAIIGVAAQKAMQALGVTNLEGVIIGIPGSKGTANLPTRVIGGAAVEGIAQEAPQSVNEQMAQNYAENKPIMEGTARQAVEGGLIGGIMGGGTNVMISAKDDVQKAETVDEAIAAMEKHVTQKVAKEQPKPAPAQPAAPQNIQEIIENAAIKHGVPVSAMVNTAGIESNFNPSAKNPNSSAGGLYQFIDSTAKNYHLANKFDPVQSADAAARLMKDNSTYLFKALGRVPSDGELYLAHQQGAGGAAKLLSNPNALAKDVVGSEAVRLNGGSPDMTAGDFAGLWTNKLGAARSIEKQAEPIITPDLETEIKQPEPEGILDKIFKPKPEATYELNDGTPLWMDGEDFKDADGNIWSVEDATPINKGTNEQSQQAKNEAPEEKAASQDIELKNAEIQAKAHEAATSPLNDLAQPTQAQKEAGNYKKGHVNVAGLDITVENPKGSKRTGIDTDGKKWSVDMNNHYGYVKRTVGADGDQVDVFIGDNPLSQNVFVVDQTDPKTGKFDEHKVMLGFDNVADAESGYRSNYSKGWNGLGAITSMPIDEFKSKLANGEFDKPIKPKATPKSTSEVSTSGPELPGYLKNKVGAHLKDMMGVPDAIQYASGRDNFTDKTIGQFESPQHALNQISSYEDHVKQQNALLYAGNKSASSKDMLESWRLYHRLNNTFEAWKLAHPEEAKKLEENTSAVTKLNVGDKVLFPNFGRKEDEPEFASGTIAKKNPKNWKIKSDKSGVELTFRPQSLKADDSIPETVIPQAKPKKPVTVKPTDELKQAITKLGGIRFKSEPGKSDGADRAGFTDFKKNRFMFHNGSKAKTFDEMAESLRELGFNDIDGENTLIEKLYDSLNGIPHYTPDGAAKYMQAQEEYRNDGLEQQEAEAAIEIEEAIDDGLYNVDDFDTLASTPMSTKDFEDFLGVANDNTSDTEGETSKTDTGSVTESNVGSQEAQAETGNNEPDKTEEVDLFGDNTDTLKNQQALADLERKKDAKRQGNVPDGGELFQQPEINGQQDIADLKADETILKQDILIEGQGKKNVGELIFKLDARIDALEKFKDCINA